MFKTKKAHRHILRIFIAMLGMALIFNQFNPAKAATDKVELYLNPASASINSGAGLSVKVFLEQNTSQDSQYVSAKIKFPPNTLSVGSLSTAGSFFANNPGDPYRRVTYNNNTGVIEISGFNSTTNIMPAGTYLVGTINFIGKGFGSAAVSFEPSSLAAEEPGDSNELTGSRGATYTVTTPAPPPVLPPPSSPAPPASNPATGSAPNSGTSSNSNGRPATSGGTATAGTPGAATPGVASDPSSNGTTDETALTPFSPDKPVITNVEVSNISANSAIVSWETTPISRATFKYGTEPTNLAQEIQLADVSNKMKVELKDLPVGKTIYYEIAEVQSDQATSYFGDFKTGNQTNGLLTIGMIVGGIIIGLGLLGAGYMFFKRRQHSVVGSAKLTPVQSYEIPTEKVVPILAPQTNFTPITPESTAPAPVPTVIVPSHSEIEPAAETVKEMPETLDPLPQPFVPQQAPFVPPAQIVAPTAHGSMSSPAIPTQLAPPEGAPTTISRQPDEATTHWPWTATPAETTSTGQGTAAKLLEDDDIPDMYEVGQERLKEVEEHLHPHKR